MKESVIEARLVRLVRSRGGLCFKFVSPGNPGVPDRIVITPESGWSALWRPSCRSNSSRVRCSKPNGTDARVTGDTIPGRNTARSRWEPERFSIRVSTATWRENSSRMYSTASRFGTVSAVGRHSSKS